MQFCYDSTCCNINHCIIHSKTEEITIKCRVIQGGIFFLVSVSIPPSLHQLEHVGCTLQAAYLLLSLKVSLLFQVEFSFNTLHFYSISAAGLILKGLICRGVLARSHTDISEPGKAKRSLLSQCLPMVLLSASARLLVPAASFYYSRNNHLANRDFSLQTEGKERPKLILQMEVCLDLLTMPK